MEGNCKEPHGVCLGMGLTLLGQAEVKTAGRGPCVDIATVLQSLLNQSRMKDFMALTLAHCVEWAI